jgi:SAM-dependent methyltransferase
LKHFLETLAVSGYRQFYLSFGDANFRKQDWLTGAKGLQSPLLDLVKLFLLQQPVSRKIVLGLLGPEACHDFVDAGILVEERRFIRSNSFYLIFCRSHALLCQMTPDTTAYFGDDSLALATWQTPTRGSVLDLCSGPGIQSFVAAGTASAVLGVDISKAACRIADLNRRLNQLENKVSFVCRSVQDFAAAGPAKFDQILFNPPLVPTPPGYKLGLAGDGGVDGLELTRQILKLYGKRLNRGGRMEFIGVGPGRKNDPVAPRDMGRLAHKLKLRGRIHLMSQHPIRAGAPLFEVCVATLAMQNGLRLEESRKVFLDHFSKLKMDAYWLFFASLTNAPVKAEAEIALIDLSSSFWGHWFV